MFPAAILIRLSIRLLLRPVPLIALMVLMALTGCKSSEERAEDYFRSAQSYIEKGDSDRALVELRNVFKYSPGHQEARLLMADTLLARGDVGAAYAQYLRLSEIAPERVPVRQTLAELALAAGDWEGTARHGKVAIELAPEAPRSQALAAALDYHDAIKAEAPETAARAAARAEALLAAHPELVVARRVAIDARLNGDDPQSALPLIDEAIARDPDAVEFRLLRHRLLLEAGDKAGAEAELIPVMADHARLGGSRAQRDLLELTLVNVLIRQGKAGEARRLLAMRRPLADIAGAVQGLAA